MRVNVGIKEIKKKEKRKKKKRKRKKEKTENVSFSLFGCSSSNVH
jgi:hypothetical protein